MANSTKDRGIKGLFVGIEKGLRMQLRPFRNQLLKGIKDLAAQVPVPKETK